MSETVQIPGWELKKLSEVTISHDGKRIPLNRSERSMIQGDFPYYGASGQVDSINDYKFDGEYMLLAEDGENLNSRKKPIAFIVKGKFWVNNHAHVLEPKKELMIEYLCYYVNSLNIMNFAKRQSTRPKLNKSTMDEIPIPLPSLSTQKKIVQKLNNIIEQLEEKKNQIFEVNQKIDFTKIIETSKKHFLKLAYTGQLTKSWRDNNPKIKSAEILISKITETRKKSYAKQLEDIKAKGLRKNKSKFLLEIPKIPKNHNLPESWTTTNIDFLGYVTKLAGFEYSKYMKPENYIDQHIDGATPLVRAQNVKMGKFDYSNKKFISRKTSDILERSQINGNEILIVSIGDIGNVCLAPTDQRWHLAPNVAKIEVDIINREYLYYYLQSSIGLQDALSRIKKTAQPSLSTENIRRINVNLSPIEEQKEIIRLIKQKFTILNNFEKSINELTMKQKSTIDKINHIQPSILDAVFSGKLIN